MLIYFGLITAFILGTVIGSGLGVCIGRIPYEKSILWPSSRCDSCLQPIRWYDNLPLISFLLLRGRCRICGAKYGASHLGLELFTGLCFAGVFYLDVVLNVLDIPAIERAAQRAQFGFGWGLLIRFCLVHVILVSFLIVTSFSDLRHLEIPLPVTITGMLVGIVLSMIFPWPWPSSHLPTETPMVGVIKLTTVPPVRGFNLWPVWYQKGGIDWLPWGSWQLGLATSVSGILAGALTLRAVRFLFSLGRGREGLGIGDADLMMMAGAFLGWQPILVAFFVSVLPALIIGVILILLRGDQMMPFGPSLAVGILLTMFGWKYLPPEFQLLFFNPQLIVPLIVVGGVLLLIASFLLRFTGGSAEE